MAEPAPVAASSDDTALVAGPRSSKGARTRARILEAAKAVFEETGFLNARISDIAERAGLSHGSFYHYFESKEQIFREVAELVDLGEPRDAERVPEEAAVAVERPGGDQLEGAYGVTTSLRFTGRLHQLEHPHVHAHVHVHVHRTWPRSLARTSGAALVLRTASS